MNNKFSTPDDADETSLNDLEEMLAAEGARGFDENLKGPSIPQLRRAGLSEVSPGSSWYVPGAVEGDWIIGAGVNAMILGDRFEGTPYYWRWLFDEKKTVFGGKKKTELVATWASEPKDACYPKGLGYSRRGNKNLLSERIVIDLIYPAPDGPTPCRLTLFGKDDRRIAETFRQRLLSKRVRGADGRMRPSPLYATRIAITANERKEERGDGRGNSIEVTVWDPVFEFLGIYPGANGPDRETIMLGRDLCAGQEAIKYPDPNAVDAAPALRVVGSDVTNDVAGDNGPSWLDPEDPGRRRTTLTFPSRRRLGKADQRAETASPRSFRPVILGFRRDVHLLVDEKTGPPVDETSDPLDRDKDKRSDPSTPIQKVKSHPSRRYRQREYRATNRLAPPPRPARSYRR